MSGMELADFLLARIAEDEAVLQIASDENWAWRMPSGIVAADRHTFRGRALAECQAKRGIIADAEVWGDHLDRVLRLLALPYADHPEWREEWRP